MDHGGNALTQELIPQVEKAYRTNNAKLLTGHSSGGWTVLWLQHITQKCLMPAGQVLLTRLISEVFKQ